MESIWLSGINKNQYIWLMKPSVQVCDNISDDYEIIAFGAENNGRKEASTRISDIYRSTVVFLSMGK